MDYTISVAWVISVEPDAIEAAPDSELHKDIVQHTVTLNELMHQKHKDCSFRCVLSDMIISAPERELGA